ncbi:CinA family protein [Psychrobacter ciconiae]|uniref:CinA family protein n=1 Tax=Psychrobacter ciconiae TaxID=1553449 RepID=UPI0019199BE2|nr:nicotinamide-nucleotide amidohydrolase family protein [Psychrobacter ciconiae]
MSQSCAKLLAQKQLSVAFIESATAGYLAHRFSLSPFSGDILQGGVVCYDCNIKTALLNVEQALIDEFTPESMPVTEALAKNAARIFDADIIVACTGLLSKGGSETPEKPVGTFFYCIHYQNQCHSFQSLCHGAPKKKLASIHSRIAKSLIEVVQSH